MPMDSKPLPPLYDARLCGMATLGFVLSGLEALNECAYVSLVVSIGMTLQNDSLSSPLDVDDYFFRIGKCLVTKLQNTSSIMFGVIT